MDSSSLQFRTAASLRQRKTEEEEEEEEKKAKRETVHQESQRLAAEATEQARFLLGRNKRKRKKKRKRKLPKGSSLQSSHSAWQRVHAGLRGSSGNSRLCVHGSQDASGFVPTFHLCHITFLPCSGGVFWVSLSWSVPS